MDAMQGSGPPRREDSSWGAGQEERESRTNSTVNERSYQPDAAGRHEPSGQPALPGDRAAVRGSILIVEDEHFITELYTRALQKAGYNVAIAIDGEDGMKKILTNQFDIVLLDIMLPNLNGIDALKQIRAKTADLPLKSKILITTNLDAGEETRAALEKIADGYLIKAEITPRQLVEYLNQLI